MNPVTYLKDTLTELKQVTWPKPSYTLKLTAVVIAISLVVAIYVGGLDLFFTNLLTTIVQ